MSYRLLLACLGLSIALAAPAATWAPVWAPVWAQDKVVPEARFMRRGQPRQGCPFAFLGPPALVSP